MTYIRFVVFEPIEGSSNRLGIFHAARYIKDDNDFAEYEFQIADSIMGWFADNLESPLDYLNRQKSSKSEQYISWFKSSADKHITKAQELGQLLQNKGVEIERITTDKPGKIVYEDEYQIFAKPFSIF